MVVTRRAQQALILFALLCIVAIYSIAWLAPAVGLYYEDGLYLVTARAIATGGGYTVGSLPHPVPQTEYPPLFPALLALFSVISMSARWLKLVPLLCGAAWFYLAWRLLLKFGATRNSALFLVALTAASPLVIHFNTNLLAEPLFALLVTSTMLVLLDGERPYTAGFLAGLATLTNGGGTALIGAGVFVFLLRGRRSHAVRFALAATILAAPWYGWAAANWNRQAISYGLGNYSALNVFSNSLALSEKFRIVSTNALSLLYAPFGALTGFTSMAAAVATGILLFWSLLHRRQLLPDLFLLFYCLMLLTWAAPPERFLVPVLPLLLWIFWRAIQASWQAEAIAAIVLLALGTQFAMDVRRLPATFRAGAFSGSSRTPEEWDRVQSLSTYIRTKTPEASVILANLDPLLSLQTGRRTVRGFRPNGYDLFYSPVRRSAQAFQLLKAMRENQVDFVVVMPDRDSAESQSFEHAVSALERDGHLEPVAVEGLTPEYRLLRTTLFKTTP